MIAGALVAAAVWAAPVTVPVDVGVGPAGLLIPGPIFADQPLHSALVFSVAAVIDKKTIRKNKKRIPKQYRDMAAGMDEVRVSPSLFIPDMLIISPKWANTGMYGVSWKPLSLGVPFVTDPVRLSADLGLRLTYLFIHSDTLAEKPTHFIRPGLDAEISLEIPFSDTWLMSMGWSAQVYIPQKLGGKVWEVGPFDETIWQVNAPFVKLHYRFPYKVNL